MDTNGTTSIRFWLNLWWVIPRAGVGNRRTTRAFCAWAEYTLLTVNEWIFSQGSALIGLTRVWFPPLLEGGTDRVVSARTRSRPLHSGTIPLRTIKSSEVDSTKWSCARRAHLVSVSSVLCVLALLSWPLMHLGTAVRCNGSETLHWIDAWCLFLSEVIYLVMRDAAEDRLRASRGDLICFPCYSVWLKGLGLLIN